MTTLKMTIKELREQVAQSLNEGSVNFWNSEYFWNPRVDTIDDLVRGALKWYSFERAPMQLSSPADPKFLKALHNRMRFLGMDEETIEQVIFKVRLHKASSAEYRPVSIANLKPVK